MSRVIRFYAVLGLVVGALTMWQGCSDDACDLAADDACDLAACENYCMLQPCSSGASCRSDGCYCWGVPCPDYGDSGERDFTHRPCPESGAEYVDDAGSDDGGESVIDAGADYVEDVDVGEDTGLDEDPDADVGPCPAGMAYVPAGPFVMGSDSGEGEDNEEPEHIVTLSDFCIDRTEVTNAQYGACFCADACTSPYSLASVRSGDYHAISTYNDFPVINIDWAQASAYCTWSGKRLPTEAEWEKAARGGCEIVAPETCGAADERTYPWGEATPTCDFANMSIDGYECYWDTYAVAVLTTGDSPYGIHDMAGNVSEWVADWYGDTYYSTCRSGCNDPTGPQSGAYRVVRGGDYETSTDGVRVASRDWVSPGPPGSFTLGIRCALTPP